MFSPTVLHTQLAAYPQTQCLWIAYSGGLDSHVLLTSLATLRTSVRLPQLHAIHIHHGLQPQADGWVTHCQAICAALAIPLTVLRVKVMPQARESIEACAREARYAAFAEQLQHGDILLTAHHADDQAETLLLQLLRGAGVAGLAAMPALTQFAAGWLARPLLPVTRAELQAYALQEQLHWIEDASNQDTRFDRNFMRHAVMPLLQQRWPAVNQVLGRAAQHQAEAQTLLNELAAQDMAACLTQVSTAIHLLSALAIPNLHTLSTARQRNVLRYWLKHCALPVPSTAQLGQILAQISHAAADKQPLVQWSGGEVRRHQHYLFAMANVPTIPAHTCLTWADLTQPLPLPYGILQADLVTHSGQGGDVGLASSQLTLPVQVRYRQGGEVWHWRGHRRSLKKSLQAVTLLPWQRGVLPLVYQGETLVAVPGVGVHDAFRAKKGEVGWVLRFHAD